MRRKSDKHEKQIVAEMGTAMGEEGRRCPASGALKWWKGDGYFDGRFRIEVKETDKSYRTIKLDELKTVANQAKGLEIPILVVRFNAKRGDIGEMFVIRKGNPWKGYNNPPNGPDGTFYSNGFNTSAKQLKIAVEDLRLLCVTLTFRLGTPEEVTYYVTKWDDFIKEIENDREG